MDDWIFWGRAGAWPPNLSSTDQVETERESGSRALEFRRWPANEVDWLTVDRYRVLKSIPHVSCAEVAAGAVASMRAAADHFDQKLTGGKVNYYRVHCFSQREDVHPYMAECEDIIAALNMTFAEGEAFKALWRSCAARQGNGKPGVAADGIYDAEKIVHYGKRILTQRRQFRDGRPSAAQGDLK